MKILRILAPAFGRLQGFDTGEDPLPPLVVVQGRNESGKSTFFEMVATVLYGFYPASRDGHGYAPWSGETAHVEADIQAGDGPAFRVRRRLLSSPAGTLIRDGAEEDLANRTLQVAGHVNRKVYRHVFALTLAEMAGLEGEEWEDIQDRLFGGLGARDLRSTREVADALEKEARSLWRPDRVGKPEIRELQKELRSLKKERREALDAEEEIRSLTLALEEARARRDEVRRERFRLQEVLERHQVLRPIRHRLAQIDDLLASAGDRDELDGLPADPRERLASLDTRLAELRERRREVRARTEAARAERGAFTESHRAFLARQGDVREALAARTRADARREEIARLERSLATRATRMEETCRAVLDRDPDDGLLAAVRELSIPRLTTALRGLDDARNRREALPEPPRSDEPLPAELPLWLPVAGFAAAVVLLGLAVAGVGGLSTLPGWIFAAAGLLLLGWRVQTSRRRRAEEAHRRERREAWEADRAERDRARDGALDRVQEILAGLEPGPHAPEPRGDWAGRLEQLRSLVSAQDDEGALLAEAREELRGSAGLLDPLVRLIPGIHGDGEREPGVAVHLLETALQETRELEQAADAADRRLAGLREEDESLARDEEGLVEERSGLIREIEGLGDGELEAGLEALERRREALALAREYRRELEGEHADLAERIGEIREAEAAGEEWVRDPEALAVTRSRIEDLGEELQELEGSIGETRTGLDHLAGRTRLDELDGAIEELESRIAALGVRRDRLWVLARIVREADRRIREAHQPAALRTAGGYLARLTGGRYDQFVQAGDDGRDFRVRGPALEGLPGSVPSHEVSPPLSQGTLEQIYTSLRLAILDEIDGGGAPLPLLLDEVMVNWDEGRRARGLDLLREVSRDRQCFFFTCHPEMAGELEERGARRIVLDAPASP